MTKVRVWGAIAAWDLSKSMIEDKVELLPFHRRSGQHSCISSPQMHMNRRLVTDSQN